MQLSVWSIQMCSQLQLSCKHLHLSTKNSVHQVPQNSKRTFLGLYCLLLGRVNFYTVIRNNQLCCSCGNLELTSHFQICFILQITHFHHSGMFLCCTATWPLGPQSRTFVSGLVHTASRLMKSECQFCGVLRHEFFCVGQFHEFCS